MPTYNRADRISKGIESVLAQSFDNWELMVVDDGSTDNTESLMANFTSDDRIHYLKKKNKERSAARNYGIERSAATYVCFLDSDDHYHKEYLAEMASKLDGLGKPKAVLISGTVLMDEDHVRASLPAPKEGQDLAAMAIERKEAIPINPVCMHRDIMTEFPFDTRFSIWEDSHLLLRVLCKYPYYSIPKDLVHVVSHAGSGVVQIRQHVDLDKVMEYMQAVDDAFAQCRPSRPGLFSDGNLSAYKHNKLSGFFYSARINGQVKVARKILAYQLKHCFAWSRLGYYVKACLKLLSHASGISTR